MEKQATIKVSVKLIDWMIASIRVTESDVADLNKDQSCGKPVSVDVWCRCWLCRALLSVDSCHSLYKHRLSHLKVLELRENHLQTLPNSLMSLSQLSRLDLGTNDFQRLVIAQVFICSILILSHTVYIMLWLHVLLHAGFFQVLAFLMLNEIEHTCAKSSTDRFWQACCIVCCVTDFDVCFSRMFLLGSSAYKNCGLITTGLQKSQRYAPAENDDKHNNYCIDIVGHCA